MMTLTVEGLLRRAGTVKIYAGAVEKDLPQKPAVFIESERSEDTFIKIVCTYNNREGFKIIRSYRSGKFTLFLLLSAIQLGQQPLGQFFGYPRQGG